MSGKYSDDPNRQFTVVKLAIICIWNSSNDLCKAVMSMFFCAAAWTYTSMHHKYHLWFTHTSHKIPWVTLFYFISRYFSANVNFLHKMGMLIIAYQKLNSRWEKWSGSVSTPYLLSFLFFSSHKCKSHQEFVWTLDSVQDLDIYNINH